MEAKQNISLSPAVGILNGAAWVAFPWSGLFCLANRFGNRHGADCLLADPPLAGTGATTPFSTAGNLPVIFRAGLFDITNRLRRRFGAGHDSISDSSAGTGSTPLGRHAPLADLVETATGTYLVNSGRHLVPGAT